MPGGGDHPGPNDNPNINPPGGGGSGSSTDVSPGPLGTNPTFGQVLADTNHDNVISPAEAQAYSGGGGGGGGGGGDSSSGGGGGSSSGGSSSSSSSSGGSSGPAPFDPDEALVNSARTVYYNLWGQYPPDSYIKGLVHQGMNIWEIEDHERHKPAFRKTKTYNEQAAGIAGTLSSILGR